MRLHRAAVMSGIVGVAVVIIATATIRHAPATTRVAEPDGGGSSPRVDVVGDSLVRQSSTLLQRELRDTGFDFRVASEPGRSLTSQVVRDRLDDVERSDAQIVVVATAANDALERTADGIDPSGSAYRERIAAMVDRFEDRCVVIVNARTRISPIYHPMGAAAVNQDLDALAAARPNVVVVDWDDVSGNLATDAFALDQLHFDRDPAVPADGSPSAAAYAHAIVGGVARCDARSGAGAGPALSPAA